MSGIASRTVFSLPKKHGARFDEKYLWDQLRPIIPCPTGRFFRGTLFQHFVPGYDHACPSGTKAIRPNSLSLTSRLWA